MQRAVLAANELKRHGEGPRGSVRIGGGGATAGWPRTFHYDPASPTFLNLRDTPSKDGKAIGKVTGVI